MIPNILIDPATLRALLTGSTRLRCADYPEKPKTMADQEHDILKLESEFPALSGQAFAAARARVLASGQSVLQSSEGVIYEVFPDGTKRAVKEIEPPTLVEPGCKFRIG